MVAPPRYDTIGRTYGATRRPDPRIAQQIGAALGDARSVVNVGAGTGSYEPTDRPVVAVEPSQAMITQRPADAAPAVRGVAEHLPFPDATFDVALATLTVHHWTDVAAGLRELVRVAGRQVILAFDRDIYASYWLVDDYFPEYRALRSERDAPNPDDIGQVLDVRRVEVVPVPGDCIDGFGGAYWQRPEAHLDPVVRAGISWLAQLDPDTVERNTTRLSRELADGTWDQKYGGLRTQESLDLGYRLLVCG
jgi:ubiquinone/menaquinone biosynthesis C-methylase UbiE